MRQSSRPITGRSSSGCASFAGGQSEDLGTPGMAVPAEKSVGARHCALLHLLYAARACQRSELHAAEECRAERLNRQSQVGIVLGSGRTSVLQLPARPSFHGQNSSVSSRTIVSSAE